MNDKAKQKHMVDMLFVIALLFLFALSAMVLIALGASIYKRSTKVMSSNYDTRTAFAYITEKLRQNDKEGEVESVVFNHSGAIKIKSRVDDIDYATYIYDYDGYLMELTAREDAGVIPPETGQKIVAIDSLLISSLGNKTYKIDIVLPDGNNITFVAASRCGKKE